MAGNSRKIKIAQTLLECKLGGPNNIKKVLSSIGKIFFEISRHLGFPGERHDFQRNLTWTGNSPL